jgi:L-rhamnose isomerase/sugar isomerase
MQLLVEYKPFEPAFYATDIADWGMAYLYAKKAGRQAKGLVDTGHHYQGVNVEQIVAWLLDEEMLGGFHFNDRQYADDDLTLGSIDPYAVFRIFHEIRNASE